MERKRIGNDRRVTMAVTRNGRPEDFSDKKLTVVLWSDLTTQRINDFKIVGNVLMFTWYGTEQKKPGKYFITLYENYGERSQNVVDSRPFVQLVSRSYQTSDRCGCDIDAPDLSLSVDIDAPVGSTDYNDLDNKPKINGVELVGDISSDELGIVGGDFDAEGMTASEVKDLLKDWN